MRSPRTAPRRSATRRGTLALLAVLAGGATLGVGPDGAIQPAAAQLADALGHPLPSPDLAVGTIMVRIVAGNPGAPVVGTDVTLTVGGTPRVARTDAAGRATFAGLPPGAKVTAKVTADGKDVASDEFDVPDAGGARVMLTTKPWNMSGAAGAAGPAGGAGPMAGGKGMPAPRVLSGTPRPDPSDPAGTITARLTYDDLQGAAPSGVPVTLIGYAADDTVSVVTVPTDGAGRAVWRDLDRSGGTSYFATALMPRGDGVDRVVSQPMILDAEVGVRVMLSAEKRDSKAPPIDDLAKLEKREGAVPTGLVRVTTEGLPAVDMPVDLVDASSGQVVAQGKIGAPKPDPSSVTGTVTFGPRQDVPLGTVEVKVIGSVVGQTADDAEAEPIPDVDVVFMALTGPAAAPGAPAPTPGAPAPTPGAAPTAPGTVTARTAAGGVVRAQLVAGTRYRATVDVGGKALTSEPFEVTTSGGQLLARATFASVPRPVAELPFAARPGQVLYARGNGGNEVYRSLPFQPTAAAGTAITLYVYPRILFTFSLTSSVDDQFLGVQGRFEVKNFSFIPYRAGPDGMVVPLPARFKGAVVANQDQKEVAVDQGNGFRIMRPIPPGGRQFHGGFSLPVEDGEVHWALNLPLGAFQSGMEIVASPGMTVDATEGIKIEDGDAEGRHYKVLPEIQLPPGKELAVTVRGLPHTEAWKRWAPKWAALFAVLMMAAGLAYGLWPRPAVARRHDQARAARRAKLLDELVELDRAGKNDKRRAQVLTELEQVWLAAPDDNADDTAARRS